MAGARTDNQRTTTERYRSPCGIEVLTYVGNIIGIQDATAVVTGEGVGFRQRSQITKALIESNCCPDFKRVRDKVIRKNEELKAWEVRTSKLNFESKFSFVFHVLMKTQENEYWIEGMKKMYERLFKKVEKYKVSTLVLPLLGSGRSGADISDAVRAVTESIALLGDRDHRHLRKLYLVTMDTQFADTMATYCQLYFQNASQAKPRRRASVRYRMGFGGPKYRDKASRSPAPVNRPKSDTFPRSGRERQQLERTVTDPGFYKTFEDQSKSTWNEPVHAQQWRDGQKTFQHDKKHLKERQQQNHNTQFQSRVRPSLNENSYQQPKISRNETGNRDWHTFQGYENLTGQWGQQSQSHAKHSVQIHNGHQPSQTKDDPHMHKEVYGDQTHADKFPEGGCIREQPILEHRHDENAFKLKTEYNHYHNKKPNGRRNIILHPKAPNYDQTGDRMVNETHVENKTRGLKYGDEHRKKTKDYKDNVCEVSVKLPPTENKQDTASAEAQGESLRICPICLNQVKSPKQLDKCGHVFCKGCIEQSFRDFKPVCPSCNMVYGEIRGNQPDGQMDVGFSGEYLPGYEGHGTITITYYFPSGTQGEDHPSPGQPYKGTTRRAYLPDCKEGKAVLKLLRKAFDRKLTFTIGRSTTTGQENVVTWNDVHHKTNKDGGPTRFGYPDPGYLERVRDELAAKGVTEDPNRGREDRQEKKETPI